MTGSDNPSLATALERVSTSTFYEVSVAIPRLKMIRGEFISHADAFRKRGVAESTALYLLDLIEPLSELIAAYETRREALDFENIQNLQPLALSPTENGFQKPTESGV